ncbi:MAG: futalosine hydrolase [Deltaproteobacteria bacterium]|nr:futalosine hydrolase [Deltaproteobacteria bacterium]
MSILWVYAAGREGEPWAGDPRMLQLGVGKVAATLALARGLSEQRPEAVVVFGVAGAHPGGPAVGEPCWVVDDWLADEGVMTPAGFVPLEALGLGRRGPLRADAGFTDRLDAALGGGLPRVVGATVSTCSGTDHQAELSRAACPQALVETMEGAAVGTVCDALGIAWAQLRVISNRTGDREAAGWDLDGALACLHPMVHRLLTALD